MGGYGSGRKPFPTKKRLVEDCFTLDSWSLVPHGVGRHQAHLQFHWNHPTGEPFLLEASTQDCRTLYLIYRVLEGDWIRDNVPLEWTLVRPGSRRLWFRCPLDGRRARRLYLPPGERHFACQSCHNLTRWTVQTHHAKVDFYLKHTEAFAELLPHSEWNLQRFLQGAAIFDRCINYAIRSVEMGRRKYLAFVKG